ncbi:retrovirus-related Pol polyprotein from transposon 412 [Trichonephila clavipes]|nr:retrovirus-related Pol polyprotein from transposon 412 [Trichonephila clavipes]
MVERFNRIILNSLSLLVSSNQQDWDKKLSIFLFAYRSVVHETTGYSPFQMLFGRDLRLPPADRLFSRPPDAPLAPEEYIEKLQARMEKMHHLARERIGMASEKMKTRYDARATGHDFHEGDKVWLWNPKRRKGLSPKLQTNWEGPYTVLRRLNDVMVRMQKSPHSKTKVCFSDESTFEILQNKVQFVHRRRGEKFHSDCVVQTVKHPTKIMIWSVISDKGTGRLYVVKGMIRQDQYKDVLQNHLIPQLEE